MSDITIRTARSQDLSDLRRIAQLDSQADIAGSALVAEVCGTAVAALELSTGRAIADPFTPTADVVELLRVRSHGKRTAAKRRHGLRLLPRIA